jgi:hypothetical protein
VKKKSKKVERISVNRLEDEMNNPITLHPLMKALLLLTYCLFFVGVGKYEIHEPFGALYSGLL